MSPLLLVLFCAASLLTGVLPSPCDPSRFLCSGQCPPLPDSLPPPDDKQQAVCARDPDSDTCVCWLRNPDRQLHSLFQCEARINDTISKVTCFPPSECFSPDTHLSCLIILQCQCLLLDHRHQFQKTDEWKRVKAVVHTMVKTDANQDGYPIEKIQDIREFSLKHLLFLLGFVIAPLLCWCVLNFFHGGKCRKKPLLQPPEAVPMPVSRTSTVDHHSDDGGDVAVCSPSSSSPCRRMASVSSCSIQIPSAPDAEPESSQQEAFLMKCESPPPYCESTDRSCPLECGPPPTYEDAVRGSDVNVQQLWQTVFILQPDATGDT